jgi:hypothetical protein
VHRQHTKQKKSSAKQIQQLVVYSLFYTRCSFVRSLFYTTLKSVFYFFHSQKNVTCIFSFPLCRISAHPTTATRPRCPRPAPASGITRTPTSRPSALTQWPSTTTARTTASPFARCCGTEPSSSQRSFSNRLKFC